MYRRILVPLEHSPCDDVILGHVRQLARLCGSSLLLIHVADGWAARNLRPLNLRESEEIRQDREYIEQCCAALRAEGFDAESVLAGGEPSVEIASAADRESCDLIAMAVHGHKGLQDVIYGQTANKVRHLTTVPVLMVRDARRATRPT
ncbi:MAG: universal stress protein [Gemmatimonadaceae bacterium]|nr:universal stress protein [Gemmatimonadaceae bacterium]